jgi:hypothetical protein
MLDSKIENHEIVERESTVNMGARRYNEYLRVMNLAINQAGLKDAVNFRGGGWARYLKVYTFYISIPHVNPELTFQTIENEACFKIQNGLIAKALNIGDTTINLAHPDSLTQIGDVIKKFVNLKPSDTQCEQCKTLWWQHQQSCPEGPYYSYWKRQHPNG